jgi:hypothetical protein
MAQQFHYFTIEYFDGSGERISSGTVCTPLDHWDLCRATWDDMPEGAEDFHLVEWAERPDGFPVAPELVAA